MNLLTPEALIGAAAARHQVVQFRLLAGYDHSYFSISSVMGDHVRWHAARLTSNARP